MKSIKSESLFVRNVLMKVHLAAQTSRETTDDTSDLTFRDCTCHRYVYNVELAAVEGENQIFCV